jgi:hypothetical protein
MIACPDDRARTRRVAPAFLVAAAMMVSACRTHFDALADAAPDGIGSSYAAAVLADQPLGYWRLDDTNLVASDASGHEITGTYGAGVTRGVSGALADDPDPAAQFDGASGVISVGANFDFPANAAFSLEAWLKPALLGDTPRHVFTKQDRQDPKQGYALLVYHELTFERFVAANGIFARFPISVDQLYHVVATYDGVTMSLYVNGTLASTATDTRTVPSIASAALIGATTDTFNFFSGVIDEVAVYGAALPAARVKEHFMAGQR